jgi:putative ABC transport system ATP-binding protein
MTDSVRTSPALLVRNLRKLYRAEGSGGEIAALDGVSLEVAPGEFVALTGPSGSGKSTLLFVVAALLAPDSGQIEACGTNPYQLRPRARARFRAEKIGLVFQDFRLLPYLDVRRNILAPTLSGAGGPDAARRADSLIEQLGLAGRSTHLPGQLSAGEQQRTALARALLVRPALLLADEPTGNLDEENARHVVGQMRAFAETGGTVLVATHDASIASAADRVLRIANGRI